MRRYNGAQVRHLRRSLRQLGIPTGGVDPATGKTGVEVSSVDGYQGREKEAGTAGSISRHIIVFNFNSRNEGSKSASDDVASVIREKSSP